MDIINKTARYIYTFHGGQDRQEKVDDYSGLISYLLDEREDLVKKVLTYTIEQLNTKEV